MPIDEEGWEDIPADEGWEDIPPKPRKPAGATQPTPAPQVPEDAPAPPPEPARLSWAEKLGGMIPRGLQELAGEQEQSIMPGRESASASEAGLRAGLGTLKNEAIGALKGLGQLAVGAGEAVREGGRRIGVLEDDEAPNLSDLVSGARRKRTLGERIRGTREALGLEAQGPIQELGAMAGKTIPAFVTGGSSLAADLATNAALAGGQTALEGGTPGQVAGSAALGVAGPAVGRLGRAVAPKLARAAVEQYTKALHPTGRAAKAEAARIVPELLRRRVSGNLEGLAARGEQLSGEAGEAIEQAYAGASKAVKKINAKALADELEGLKAPFVADAASPMAAFEAAKGNPALADLAQRGKIVLNEPAVAAISDIQDQLRRIKPDPESLWRLRRNLDNIVRATNGFERPLPPQAQAAIARDARAVIQKELTKSSPDLSKLNEEYRLWESLQHVASETALRKTGQQGASGMLARAAGGAAGGAIGGIPGAFVGQGVTKQLTDIVSSPRWRTVSAVQKAKIADLLAKGANEELARYLSRIVAVSATRPTQGVEQARRRRSVAQGLE